MSFPWLLLLHPVLRCIEETSVILVSSVALSWVPLVFDQLGLFVLLAAAVLMSGGAIVTSRDVLVYGSDAQPPAREPNPARRAIACSLWGSPPVELVEQWQLILSPHPPAR